jgi:hypothetical protein
MQQSVHSLAPIHRCIQHAAYWASAYTQRPPNNCTSPQSFDGKITAPTETLTFKTPWQPVFCTTCWLLALYSTQAPWAACVGCMHGRFRTHVGNGFEGTRGVVLWVDRAGRGISSSGCPGAFMYVCQQLDMLDSFSVMLANAIILGTCW